MIAYKFKIFSKQDRCYLSGTWFTVEKVTKVFISLKLPEAPAEPSDYFEIHRIQVCKIETIDFD